MNDAERAAIEALLFGGEPGQRVTRAVRIRSATLSEGIRPGEDGRKAEVAETEEQLGYRAAYQVSQKRGPDEWHGYYAKSPIRVGDLTASLVSDDTEGPDESEQDVVIIIKVEADDGRVVFLRTRGTTDSYGENTRFHRGWTIVQPKTKTVTVYE